MHTKHYIKDDGTEVTEHYESWYESAFCQAYIGILYFIFGFCVLVSAPFMAIYYMFKPQCISYGESKKILFNAKKKEKNAETIKQTINL